MEGEYEKVELLGSGSFGKAWLVNTSKTNRQAVMKEIKLDCLSDKEIGQAMVEVKILARCRHVNIVAYCEAFVSSGCLHIVMELAEKGDMQKKIFEQRGIHFENEIILDWFIQICFALKYLHSENILHRDLKPQNLFLTSDGIVKVGDFGIARILRDTADHALTAIGTPYYISPEICQRKLYNSKSDMWSAGCVLYELCCLRVPFQAPNVSLLILKILEGAYDPVPSHCGAVLEDLVAVLLKTDPSQRPSAEQVLSVPALQTQVKLTYSRCLHHKQSRYRERALSREASSDAAGSEGKGKKSPVCQKTFSVQSPLLQRLSVATPKLKAAIKRQRSAQSAETAATIKRQKKGTEPPVFNLQEAVISPHDRHSPNLDYNHSRHSNSHHVTDDRGSEVLNDFDEVFENEGNVAGKDSKGTCHWCMNEKDCDNVPTKLKLWDRFPDVYNQPETEDTDNDSNTDRVRGTLVSDNTCDVKSCKSVGSYENDCGSEHGICLETEDEDEARVLRILSSRESPHSETYTVMTPTGGQQGESSCPQCGHGLLSQQCLYETLYSATALSFKDKSSALLYLSRYLINHLGADLSLHLCSIVNSTLHSASSYSVLKKSLDESCNQYLPVILQLLSWYNSKDGVLHT